MKTEADNSRVALFRSAEKPILDELSKIGYSVDTIMDLIYMKKKYKSAIPLLVEWLPQIENQNLKEAIVRVLSVPWARGSKANSVLINEFRKAPSGSSLKWAIANALEVVADDNSYDEIVNLVQDPRNGSARQMLALALGNMINPHAQDILIDLLEDDQVAGHAIMALGKLGSIKSFEKIERFANHPKTWVRNEAKKALLRIEKSK